MPTDNVPTTVLRSRQEGQGCVRQGLPFRPDQVGLQDQDRVWGRVQHRGCLQSGVGQGVRLVGDQVQSEGVRIDVLRKMEHRQHACHRSGHPGSAPQGAEIVDRSDVLAADGEQVGPRQNGLHQRKGRFELRRRLGLERPPDSGGRRRGPPGLARRLPDRLRHPKVKTYQEQLRSRLLHRRLHPPH
jgi:hypothetical protein